MTDSSKTGFISSHDHFRRNHAPVLDLQMAYVDVGTGHPVVFLHGNPTSSYLWRNVIHHVLPKGRCVAPDLVGMGQSDPTPDGSYRFVDHARYLDAWFDELGLRDNVTLVLHDWGSALGFHWCRRYPDRVKALVYMEAIVAPVTWADWPEGGRKIFQAMRSPAGEEIVLEKNIFIERILPSSILRTLSPQEMDAYRAPFQEKGERRRPMLTWPREIPIEGEPADVQALVEDYSEFLKASDIPKLFINAEPGMILTGRLRDECRTWKNQREITVKGLHFIQEDSPHEIGHAIAEFLDGL